MDDPKLTNEATDDAVGAEVRLSVADAAASNAYFARSKLADAAYADSATNGALEKLSEKIGDENVN